MWYYNLFISTIYQNLCADSVSGNSWNTNSWKWHTRATFLSNLITMHLLWTWCLTPVWAEAKKSSSTLLRKGHGGNGSRSKMQETMKILQLAKKPQSYRTSIIQEESISHMCFLSTHYWSLLETGYLLQLQLYIHQYCKISQESSVLQTCKQNSVQGLQ